MTEPTIPEPVLRRMQGHAYAYPSAEVGGILLGSFAADESEGTRVVASLPAFDARGDLTSLTFTHEAWADLHAMKEVQYPDEAIVGWYHSHPGHGIFLSEQDLFVHRNFFPHEASVAYVVDPVRHEEGLFELRLGDLDEVYNRPLDTPEAATSRRSTARRGPGARESAMPRRARDSEPLSTVLTDAGILGAAIVVGVVAARVVFAG